MNRPLLAASMAFAALSVAFAISMSQDEAKRSDPIDPNDPLAKFSIKNSKDIDLVTRARKRAIEQCTEILATRAKQNGQKGERQFALNGERAARLLGELRAKDSECIDALCDNLTLQAELVTFSEDANSPLLLFPAARALVDIGGREAADGVFRRMKRKLDRKELLICAHVLNLIDNQRVTFERMQVAKEQSRANDSPEVRNVFFDNLAQVKKWIEDPRFETDDKFRP